MHPTHCCQIRIQSPYFLSLHELWNKTRSASNLHIRAIAYTRLLACMLKASTQTPHILSRKESQNWEVTCKKLNASLHSCLADSELQFLWDWHSPQSSSNDLGQAYFHVLLPQNTNFWLGVTRSTFRHQQQVRSATFRRCSQKRTTHSKTCREAKIAYAAGRSSLSID